MENGGGNRMPGLKDVAALAGVSPITVSRVLNEPDKVKEKTKQKVLQAMEELKYSPNMAAKNLAASRSGVIDVYIPETLDLSNAFVAYFIAGISQGLSRRMYSFLILRDRRQEHRCDGYIVTGLLKDEIYDFARYAGERGRPVALFGHSDAPGVDCIDVDNVLGAKEITAYLLKLGHRNIAMINAQDEKDFPLDRLHGFQEALRREQIEPQTCPVVSVPNTFDGGKMGVRELFARGKPTALFCASDTLAVGACLELSQMGLRVPEDVSVAGFDALGHHLLTSPALTTVRQPIFEVGEMLANALVDRLEGRTQEQHILVPPELLPAQSAAPLKSQNQ